MTSHAFHDLFFKKYLLNLQDRDREHLCFLVDSPNVHSSWAWAVRKPRSWNSVGVLHSGHLLLLSQVHSRGAGLETLTVGTEGSAAV